MKNEEYIGELLKKFMQAETTEQQESELADYFRHVRDIPDEWEAYKQYFKAFDSEEVSSSNKGHTTLLLTRKWYYAVACVAAVIVCAVALRYALYTSEDGKRLATETAKLQSAEATLATDTTVVDEHPLTALEAKQDVSGKAGMKWNIYSRSRRPDRAECVPVPKPVTATEARHYVVTSTETMIEEPSHRIKAADIDASVAYIQSRGENLERQVLASKGGSEYHMHVNKNLEQNL